MSQKRRVIVHDWLRARGGAEKVLEEIIHLTDPKALYTLVNFLQNPFEKVPVYTSFLQKIPLASSHFTYLFPLCRSAITSFDLGDYDTIISSSWAFAKGVHKEPHQVHICYCHTPMRYIWDLQEEYLLQIATPFRPFAKRLFHSLREWDKATANNVDLFIANSKYVRDRIKRIYNREAKIIYPPIDTNRFIPSIEKREKYYLIVSRLVAYKRIDLLIRAFNKIGKKLLIIGEGEERKRLMDLADNRYVHFLGHLPFEEVVRLMKRARGFVYAALEDFGMAVVEAQACGTPVIAYGVGGTAESVIDGETGVLFKKQSIEAIVEAIERFEKIEFDPKRVVSHAKKFDKSIFRKKFITTIQEVENGA